MGPAATISRIDVASTTTLASPMAPTVVVVGNVARPEFARVAEWVGHSASIVACRGVATAETRLNQGLPADLVLLVESRPGEISHPEVEQLRRLVPLARIVALLGSWCEGEVRVGDPWPGVVRVYWHQAEAHVRREMARLAAGRCPIWGLPPTADAGERLLADIVASAPTSSPRGLVTIASNTYSMADWLAEACHDRGFSTAWQRPGRDMTTRGAVLGIWDSSVGSPNELAAFRRWRRRHGAAACLVLLDFPRLEDVERYVEAGAAAVLSKPVLLSDLDETIDAVLAVSPSPHRPVDLADST